MLKWAFIFLAVAIVAGGLGFTGIAGAAAGIAKLLFFVALAVFLVIGGVVLFTAGKLAS